MAPITGFRQSCYMSRDYSIAVLASRISISAKLRRPICNPDPLLLYTGALTQNAALYELHGQRIVGVKPSIAVGPFITGGEGVTQCLLIMHVEQRAVGIRRLNDARSTI